MGGGSDVFGASSINNSVTAAGINTANEVGNSIDGSGTMHNNISTTGSQQLSNTGTVSLISVSVDGSTGVETAAATYGVDVSLSGQIGVVLADGADTIYDFSNQSTELQQFAANIADATHVWDAAEKTLTVDDGSIVDFGDMQVSSLRINESGTDANTASGIESLEINRGGRTDENGIAVSSTFTVQNNVGARKTDANAIDNGADGQLNVHSTSVTSSLTGGKLLSDLKDLGTNELTSDVANSFMSTIDEAMSQLNANRSDFGSTQNQIESSLRNMQVTQVNLKAAESVIRDVDYAAESANFNKQNIISQAGTYAMSQANSMSQNVMRLLQ
jgi:flagellin